MISAASEMLDETKTGSEEPAFPLLGERLVEAGLISADNLRSALTEQPAKRARLGEMLTEMGLVEEEEVLPFLAQQLGMESVRLRDGLIDPHVVKLLPRKMAERLQAVVLLKVRDTITVAMSEPQDLRRIDEIERITGLRVRPVLAMQSAVAHTLKRCYEEDFAVDAVTADIDRDAVEVDTQTIKLELQDDCKKGKNYATCFHFRIESECKKK